MLYCFLVVCHQVGLVTSCHKFLSQLCITKPPINISKTFLCPLRKHTNLIQIGLCYTFFFCHQQKSSPLCLCCKTDFHLCGESNNLKHIKLKAIHFCRRKVINRYRKKMLRVYWFAFLWLINRFWIIYKTKTYFGFSEVAYSTPDIYEDVTWRSEGVLE